MVKGQGHMTSCTFEDNISSIPWGHFFKKHIDWNCSIEFQISVYIFLSLYFCFTQTYTELLLLLLCIILHLHTFSCNLWAQTWWSYPKPEGEVEEIKHRYVPPPPALRLCASHLWSLRSQLAQPTTSLTFTRLGQMVVAMATAKHRPIRKENFSVSPGGKRSASTSELNYSLKTSSFVFSLCLSRIWSSTSASHNIYLMDLTFERFRSHLDH